LTVGLVRTVLAQEASSVTYDWDTDSLFVVGDGGTSVVQVDKTGHLIDPMTLAPGSSPQGTEFYDTEGIAYVGGGRFVLAEERYRQIDRFTYVPGSTLTRGDVQTGIDFAAGTATNGSPTTQSSTNLFDPALAGLADFSDVFALSNLSTLTGADASHLLVTEPGVGQDRQHRPLRERLERADDRL
jgi:hypothetical protein